FAATLVGVYPVGSRPVPRRAIDLSGHPQIRRVHSHPRFSFAGGFVPYPMVYRLLLEPAALVSMSPMHVDCVADAAPGLPCTLESTSCACLEASRAICISVWQLLRAFPRHLQTLQIRQRRRKKKEHGRRKMQTVAF